MFIIVIGCRDKKTLRMRTMRAAGLARKQIGSRVLIMGNSKTTKAMAELLSTTPICRRVSQEPNCTSTAEMALLSSSHVPKAMRNDVTIVTSAIHSARAKMLFEARLGVTCRVVEVERSGIVGSTEAEERKRETKKMEEFMVHRAICLSGSQK